MKLSRNLFLRKIRALGYRHRRDAKTVSIYGRYREDQGVHFIEVSRTQEIQVMHVILALRQAGCSDKEIADFLTESGVPKAG